MVRDSSQALAATLAQLQRTHQGVLLAPRDTIRAPLHESVQPSDSANQHHRQPFQAAGPQDLVLPYLQIASDPVATSPPNADANADADLKMIGLLGEGGMGRVDLAIQRVFDRTVAVKRVRPDQAGAGAMAALIREARTTGSLEHPNIVPAYALGRGADGPMLVMKRVQGVPWSTLIYHDDHAAWDGHSGDRLSRHLEILMHVCNGIELAHRRGIVHRDLKPDNIMVGELGEVYVLDWGVAAHLNEPRNDDIAGTPSYMAPEMLDGSVGISARTDVYLLGGLLHEVLVHAPRHAGNSLMEVLASVAESAAFAYDATVPRELAEICNRATAHDPADRFESALAFRAALARFLEHRGSLDLCGQGELYLKQLRAVLAQPTATAAGVDSRETARRLAAEADFGFRQALRIWPENTVAQAQRQTLLEVMIGFELEQQNAPGALALLQQLPEPRPALQLRIEKLQASLLADGAARAQLEQHMHEGDVRVGGNLRVALAVLFYGGLGAMWLVMAWLGIIYTTFMLLMTSVVVTVGYGAVVLFGRRTLLVTQLNRRMHGSLMGSSAWGTFIMLMAWRAALPIDFAVVLWLSAYALTNMMITIWTVTKTAKLTVALICLTFALSICLSLFWPGHALLALAAAYLGTIPVAMIRSTHWASRR